MIARHGIAPDRGGLHRREPCGPLAMCAAWAAGVGVRGSALSVVMGWVCGH